MRYNKWLSIIVALLASSRSAYTDPTACFPDSVSIYVDSAAGQDSNSGLTVAQPLRTIRVAHNKVNTVWSTCAKTSGCACPSKITVLLSNSAPHVIAASGATLQQQYPIPISYQTYGSSGKQAEVTSAINVPSSCFQPVTPSDPNYAQISPSNVGSTFVCDIGVATGLSNADFKKCQLGFRMESYGSELALCTETQVYTQAGPQSVTQMLHHARWPNRQDNTYIPQNSRVAGIFEEGTLPIEAAVGDAGENYASNNPLVQFRISKPKSTQANLWKTESELFFNGVTGFSWTWSRARINFVEYSAPNVVLQFAKAFTYKVTNLYFNVFYIMNALSELDTAEEFFMDTYKTASPRLYMYFPDKKVPSSVYLSGTASTKPLITISNTSKVSFSNIAFSISSNAAIYGENVSGLNVTGCSFQNIGQEGIKLLQSSDSIISSSTFNDMGNSAMLLDGKVKAPPLVALGNTIQRVSWLNRVYSAGITTSGFGVVVRGNILRQGPHGGIYLRKDAQNHTVDGNEVDGFARNYIDFGNIYFFAGDTVPRYHVISNNYVHDSPQNAVYLDNFSSSITVTGNLMTRIRAVTMRSNYGINNVITGNYMLGIQTPFKFLGDDPISNCNTVIVYQGNTIATMPDYVKGISKAQFKVQIGNGFRDCPNPPPGFVAPSIWITSVLRRPAANPAEDRLTFKDVFKFPGDN